MKITKTQLKQIIKEEVKNITPTRQADLFYDIEIDKLMAIPKISDALKEHYHEEIHEAVQEAIQKAVQEVPVKVLKTKRRTELFNVEGVYEAFKEYITRDK
tara:strand:+ start:197 stop:499 length:303 start_codon:yes stop_codon:yes gene_type:complete